MSLLEKLLKSNAKGVEDAVLTDSEFYKRGAESVVTTPIPTFNIALSGDIKGGLTPGITIFAGESGSGKTVLSWVAAKSFQTKFKEGVILFYDSEGGTPPDYLRALGIDTSRVIHIPIYNVEELKFDLVKRLESIDSTDKVYVLVDSLGLLASKKEVDDAVNEKAVADMSRAKAIRSMFRVILPHFTSKGIYSVFINHSYAEMGCFDADTLIQTDNGFVKICDIKLGDMVKTNTGFKPVTYCFKPDELKSDGKKYLKITFSDGTSIKCTDNHKFLMADGEWVEAKNLNSDSVFM
jgi:RecA/RadA recombinase